MALLALFAAGVVLMWGESQLPSYAPRKLGVGPFIFDMNGVTYNDHRRVVTILGVGFLVALLVTLAPAVRRRKRRLAASALVLCLLTSALGAVALARYPALRPMSWLSRDGFHYLLGTKYFDELGYDGLYECAIWVEHEADIKKRAKTYRDLRTNRVHRVSKLIAKGPPACRARFSDERWAAFTDDTLFYIRVLHRWRQFDHVLSDHGYNGTPALVAVISAVGNLVPMSQQGMAWLGLANLLAIMVALFSVLRWIGWREALLLVAVLSLYQGDALGHWTSIPRYFWLSAMVVGFAALRGKRFAIAGAALAFATMLKAFPAVYVFGPLIALGAAAVWPVSPTVRGNARRALAAYVGAGCVTTVALFAWSLATRQGLTAWEEFFHQMSINGQRLAGGCIGLRYLFLHPVEERGYKLALANLHAPLLGPLTLAMLQAATAAVLTTGVVVHALVLRRPADAAVRVGIGLMVCFLAPVRYYYAGLQAVSLLFSARTQRRQFAALACFTVVLCLLGTEFWGFEHKTVHNGINSVAMSLLVAVLALGPPALALWRRRRQKPQQSA